MAGKRKLKAECAKLKKTGRTIRKQKDAIQALKTGSSAIFVGTDFFVPIEVSAPPEASSSLQKKVYESVFLPRQIYDWKSLGSKNNLSIRASSPQWTKNNENFPLPSSQFWNRLQNVYSSEKNMACAGASFKSFVVQSIDFDIEKRKIFSEPKFECVLVKGTGPCAGMGFNIVVEEIPHVICALKKAAHFAALELTNSVYAQMMDTVLSLESENKLNEAENLSIHAIEKYTKNICHIKGRVPLNELEDVESISDCVKSHFVLMNQHENILTKMNKLLKKRVDVAVEITKQLEEEDGDNHPVGFEGISKLSSQLSFQLSTKNEQVKKLYSDLTETKKLLEEKENDVEKYKIREEQLQHELELLKTPCASTLEDIHNFIENYDFTELDAPVPCEKGKENDLLASADEQETNLMLSNSAGINWNVVRGKNMREEIVNNEENQVQMLDSQVDWDIIMSLDGPTASTSGCNETE